MSNNTKNKKNILKNKFVWIIFSILAVVVLFVLEATNSINIVGSNSKDLVGETTSRPTPSNTIDYDSPKSDDIVVSPEKSSTTEPKLDNSTKSGNISVLITTADRSSIGVYIEKISSGACNLSITQSGIEKISMTANVIEQRDYSTCQGFDIDSTKLDSSPFTAKVTINSDTRTGIATKEVK